MTKHSTGSSDNVGKKKEMVAFPQFSLITTHWRDWWAVLNLTLVYSLFGSNLFQVYSKFMQVCMWARAFSYSLFGSNLSSIYSLRFQIYSRENNVLSTIYLLRLDSIFSDQSKKKGIAAGRFGWLSARIWRTLSQRIHNKLSHKKLVKKLQFELRLEEIEMELMKRKEVTEEEDPVFHWALYSCKEACFIQPEFIRRDIFKKTSVIKSRFQGQLYCKGRRRYDRSERQVLRVRHHRETDCRKICRHCVTVQTQTLMDWWSPESTPTTIRPRRAATFNLFVVLGEILDTYSATWEVRSVRQIVGKSADTVWQCKPQTPIQFILCTRRNIGHLFNLILLWSRSHDDKKQLRPCPSQVLLPQQTFRLLRWYHAEQGWGQEYPQAQGHTFEEIDVLEQRFCETDCRKICRHCKRVRDDNDWDLRPKSLKKKFQKKDPFPESFLAALTCWQFINQTCIEFWCQLALLCLQKKDMTKCAHFHVILHRFVCLGCTLCWKSSPPARKENLSWKGWMIRFIRKSSRGSSTLFLREKFYFCVRDTYSFYSEFIRRDMVRSFIQDTRWSLKKFVRMSRVHNQNQLDSKRHGPLIRDTYSVYSLSKFILLLISSSQF